VAEGGRAPSPSERDGECILGGAGLAHVGRQMEAARRGVAVMGDEGGAVPLLTVLPPAAARFLRGIVHREGAYGEEGGLLERGWWRPGRAGLGGIIGEMRRCWACVVGAGGVCVVESVAWDCYWTGV
jgi:hypothetical protein